MPEHQEFSKNNKKGDALKCVLTRLFAGAYPKYMGILIQGILGRHE